MRAITLVGATPNRLSAVYKHLADEGGNGQERSRLAALIGPSSLARSEEAGEDNAFADCLAVGNDLGLFVIDGDNIRLAAPPTQEPFEELLSAVMIDRVGSATTPEGAVAGAIAWILCQDPRVPLKWTGSASVMLRMSQFVEGVSVDFGMTNNSRFQQAVYWARALGFVQRTFMVEELVIPDPTVAMERRLNRLIPRGTEKPLSTFLAELADCCPVFEGGSVRVEVEEMLRPEFRREAGTLSASTALAFHRLKHRGLVEFRRLDDSQVIFIEGMLDDGRVSHISRK
jgi:hypothetical protein